MFNFFLQEFDEPSDAFTTPVAKFGDDNQATDVWKIVMTIKHEISKIGKATKYTMYTKY